MKKVIALLLSLTMVVGMLTACGAKEEAPAEAPAATEEVAAVDNDTVPLRPLPEEVSAPTEVGTEEKKEVEVSVASTLPTSPLTPEVPAVDSPSGVVDNPVETQEEKKSPLSHSNSIGL